MANILLLEQCGYLGDDLKFFFEEAGHSVGWYRTPKDIKQVYNNVPKYDVAVVNKSCDVNIPEFSSDDLVKKLKQLNPGGKIICLTELKNICELADKNIILPLTKQKLTELINGVNV